MPPGSDATAMEALAAFALVERQLREASDRLTDVVMRAGELAAETCWRTDAATAFHATAEAWRSQVANLTDLVDGVRFEVASARRRIEAISWVQGR